MAAAGSLPSDAMDGKCDRTARRGHGVTGRRSYECREVWCMQKMPGDEGGRRAQLQLLL